jgi:hypothetical protein
MKLNEELLQQLKSHTTALMTAMPDLSKEERISIITKAITDSIDIPAELKEETIQELIKINV